MCWMFAEPVFMVAYNTREGFKARARRMYMIASSHQKARNEKGESASFPAAASPCKIE